MCCSLHILIMESNKTLIEELEIPNGVMAKIEGNVLTMKKDNEEINRKLNGIITIKISGNKLIFESGTTKNKKKILGSMMAHAKNMIKGLNEKFQYRLQISNVHFPMNAVVDKEKNELVVKNFLGEKKDRRIKLISGISVKVNKDIIEIESSDIEKAGQCAANIEKGTKVRNRDRRIFQDGIFITKKPRRSFL
jgi:large subunit ribosomal protein L6